MYDLIGFWFGVTLCVWFLSMPIACVALWALEVTVSWASRGRVSLDKMCSEYLPKYLLVDIVQEAGVVVFTLISVVLWCVFGIYCFAMTMQDMTPNTIIDIVNNIALFTTPFMGAVGMLATVFGGGALVMRKLFDLFFGVKDRLDKLDKA